MSLGRNGEGVDKDGQEIMERKIRIDYKYV